MFFLIIHPFPPLYDKNSRILILGSFPSVKSREENFFYGHPQNRFWKVTSSVMNCDTPVSVDEKRKFLLSSHIALWDVIGACEIEGSSDSSIRNVTANDISEILDNCNISAVFVNGKTAEKYYKKYTEKITGIKAFCLPSTSPANAAWTLERLKEEWSVIRKYLIDERKV